MIRTFFRMLRAVLPPNRNPPVVLADLMPLLGTAVFLLYFLFVPSVREPWHFIPFAASLLIFGLPHGALDHLVIARVGNRPLFSGRTIGLLLAYLGAFGVMLGVWAAWPVAAFAFFIMLTWFHWGQGDAWHVTAGTDASRGFRIASLVIRGSLPMLVPLVFFPEVYRETAMSFLALYGRTDPGLLELAFSPLVRGAVGAALAAGIIGHAVHGRHELEGRTALRNLVELLLLAAFFAVVPPILAIGLYFCFWHAPRHLIRLDGFLALGARRESWTQFGRTMLASLPLTLGALILLGLLYLVQGPRVTSAMELLALYLVLIAGLTVPHTLVVTALDARQQFWLPSYRGVSVTSTG